MASHDNNSSISTAAKTTAAQEGPETNLKSSELLANTMDQNDAIWFCPSRWLLAHHDPQANITTMSSHLCLADLNNDGENLLALVDFKPNQITAAATTTTSNLQPYQCRLRVYRGKHLIYNHFLDDIPSCMVVTSNRVPIIQTAHSSTGAAGNKSLHTSINTSSPSSRIVDRMLLTLTINDDVYFYHRLKPQHRISLEDDERILDTLNKSEMEAWQQVKQNKVDVETMQELLVSLSDAHGSQELTSHSNNFLALANSEERKNYLLLWKFKKLSNGIGEHIMSMDTICCAASRLRYDSSKLGDQQQFSSSASSSSSSRWNSLLDIQKDGIVLGTEDRHLLIYELGYSRAYLEANYRLPSTADHILVERRSPMNFDHKCKLQELTYKIIVSCRNCRIYSIDQKYLPDRKHWPNSSSSSSLASTSSSPVVRELIALSSNVIDMCWTAEDGLMSANSSESWPTTNPNFIVACLDRRVYCFSSKTGQNKWIAELELPITCLVSLPIVRVSQDETCLIGVASQTNRIDFYIGSTGRIVDSIYLSDDYCQAMTFGRFGREDNCLCLTTNKGSLLILILKRTAKFANAQCLSSAASYAAYVVSTSCSQSTPIRNDCYGSAQAAETHLSSMKLTRLKEPPELPKPFAITKSTIVNPTDRALDQLQYSHNCEQIVAKEALDLHLMTPRLQIPVKNRDFVDQIVHQARHATVFSKALARDMIKLRDKVRLAYEQQGDMVSYESANRVSLTNVTGLGNVYGITLTLQLDFSNMFVNHENGSGIIKSGEPHTAIVSETIVSQVILFIANKQRRCHIQPFKFELELKRKQDDSSGPGVMSKERDCKKFISESTVNFKLILLDSQPDSDSMIQEQDESIALDVHVLPPKLEGSTDYICSESDALCPAFVSSINIPTNQ